MKYTIEHYINFINHFIAEKEGHLLSLNKIYTLFCSYYDINPKEFPIKSFSMIFSRVYKDLNNKCLEKHQKRINPGESPVTCIKNIYIIPFGLTTNWLQSNFPVVTSSLPVCDEVPMLFKEQTAEVLTIGLRLVHDDMTDFVQLFRPGMDTDTILTQTFLKLYKEFYKNSPKHLALIANEKMFKLSFKPCWDKIYSDFKLTEANEYRKKGYGRGYKGIKLKNSEMFDPILLKIEKSKA